MREDFFFFFRSTLSSSLDLSLFFLSLSPRDLLSNSLSPRDLLSNSLSFSNLPSFPFLLVDRVVELVPQKYAVGYKVRKEEETFFCF